jgi:hypothetical protein
MALLRGFSKKEMIPVVDVTDS